MKDYIDLAALGHVLVASLLGGAGLVAVFALGLRAADLVTVSGDGDATPGPARRAAGFGLAGIAFAVVVVGVALGIYAMLNKPA